MSTCTSCHRRHRQTCRPGCLLNTIWVAAIGSLVAFLPVALSPVRHIVEMPERAEDGTDAGATPDATGASARLAADA
jgi:hypothetical protein